MVKSLDQLPKRVKAWVFVKTTGSAPETMKVLGTFNKGLRTSSWRLLQFRQGAGEGDSSLLVSFPETELRELQALDMHPRLGLGRAKCVVLAGGARGAGERSKTGGEGEEQGPETSNMEIDNPGPFTEPAEDAALETGGDLPRQ